ncbi:MAG: hypothetical protein AAGI46_14405 [Planctomycetota bacterium]
MNDNQINTKVQSNSDRISAIETSWKIYSKVGITVLVALVSFAGFTSIYTIPDEVKKRVNEKATEIADRDFADLIKQAKADASVLRDAASKGTSVYGHVRYENGQYSVSSPGPRVPRASRLKVNDEDTKIGRVKVEFSPPFDRAPIVIATSSNDRHVISIHNLKKTSFEARVSLVYADEALYKAESDKRLADGHFHFIAMPSSVPSDSQN